MYVYIYVVAEGVVIGVPAFGTADCGLKSELKNLMTSPEWRQHLHGTLIAATSQNENQATKVTAGQHQGQT